MNIFPSRASQTKMFKTILLPRGISDSAVAVQSKLDPFSVMYSKMQAEERKEYHRRHSMCERED